MDPLRASRLGLDAVIVVTINALAVVMIASARWLPPAIAGFAWVVAAAIATLVIIKVRRERNALAALASCDMPPHDGFPEIWHL
jgi:predicted anti-sigma-YlaC factor YlaD